MRTIRSLLVILAAIIILAPLGGCSVFERHDTTLHGHDHINAIHDRHDVHAVHHVALSDSNVDDHDQIARHDMERSAAHSLPHSSALFDTYGRAEHWSADWELRWIDYQTPAGTVRVYHATSRHGDDT